MRLEELLNPSLHAIRFGTEDPSDHEAFPDLRQMVEECDNMYPDIERWFEQKVAPGLKSGERRAILVCDGRHPVASAIIRRGADAKLCSLRVKGSHTFRGIGKLIMALIGLELRHDRTRQIHLTIPEETWKRDKDFFQGYGFSDHGAAGTQYRLFDRELACATTFKELWLQVNRSLREMKTDSLANSLGILPDIIMSLHPKHAQAILNGIKTVEVRKNFPKHWRGSVVLFYATEPMQELVGQAVISAIDHNTPTDIWEKYKDDLGCDYEEYRTYCGNHLKISAIRFEHVESYRDRVPKTQLEVLISETLRPPQSYGILENNAEWLAAVSLSKLLRSAV